MSENFFRGKRRQIILILVCNLIAAILFSSWYRTQKISASEDGKVEVNYSLAGQDSLWGQLDFSVFRKLNGSLKNHRAAQSFWALANNRASDLISAACMGAVLWFGATRIASPVEKIERLKVGLFLLLAALVFVQVLRVSLFDFYRPSASLVIEEGTIRLSQLDHVGWRLEDSSQRSFPGDHGSVLLVGAVYVSCFSIVAVLGKGPDRLACTHFSALSFQVMSTHIHENHDHQHGDGCGHTAIRHADHLDYLHDGHLHHQKADGTVEEHTLEVTAVNPDGCTAPEHASLHEDGHHHGPGCGHEAVPHGDHVDGRLHHPHGDHCDDHGSVERVALA